MKMRLALSSRDGMTVALLVLLYHTCLGLDVTAPSSQTALFKSRVVLPCTFRVNAPPINPQFLAIIWSFETKDLLRFDNKEKVVSDGGVSLDEQAARQGNASLTIHNVTIANHGTYKCLVIYSPDRTSRDIQLNVQATPMVKIHKMGLHKNEKNQVDCSITGFFPMESLIVTWLRNDIKIQGGSKMGTFQTGADGTVRVSNSIILTPDQIQDRPSIICQVEHASLQKPIQDGFLVTYKVAPKVQLTSSRTADGNEYLYVCEARGFSPEPLSINWLVDGKMANLSRGREDGLYNKEIYYRVNYKEGNVPERISCNIQHEALNSPFTETLEVPGYNECKRHCHLGLTAVLISLLVISLAAIFYILRKYIRKKKYLKQFQVSHIHKELVRGNEEKVNLYCMAFKCPDVAKVTWTVTEQNQKPIIIESSSIKDEEAGQLIDHEYTEKTDQTEDNGLKNYTTVLSFNPTISIHKNTKIKCKLQCGVRCEERTLNFIFCLKKPLVKKPIHLSLDDEGNVLCSLTLENFYPRDVKIKWNCGVGNNQELPSTEDIKNDSDYTSQCNSTCWIPWQHFQDPAFKVRVTWKHESLDQPGHQELSLKDFPWRPVMNDIEVPSLIHGREAKLQCVIGGYFPDNLEVRWLRREAGKPELYEVSSGSDRYKIPVLEIKQESDKTYTCTASLIVSVLLKADHKSEFICRVTHPILETPLEKRTGEIAVTGRPTVTRKQDGKMLTAEISHFYPKKITVTWSGTKNKNELEDKLEPIDGKEYTVSEPSPEGDGTFSITSSVKKPQENKLYKITVTHESMQSPIEKTYKKVKETFEDVTEKQEETAQGEMWNSEVEAQGGGEETPTMNLMQPGKKNSTKKGFKKKIHFF